MGTAAVVVLTELTDVVPGAASEVMLSCTLLGIERIIILETKAIVCTPTMLQHHPSSDMIYPSRNYLLYHIIPVNSNT